MFAHNYIRRTFEVLYLCFLFVAAEGGIREIEIVVIGFVIMDEAEVGVPVADLVVGEGSEGGLGEEDGLARVEEEGEQAKEAFNKHGDLI